MLCSPFGIMAIKLQAKLDALGIIINIIDNIILIAIVKS